MAYAGHHRLWKGDEGRGHHPSLPFPREGKGGWLAQPSSAPIVQIDADGGIAPAFIGANEGWGGVASPFPFPFVG